MAQALAHPELVSLAAGFVDQQSLPANATREAMQAIWSDPAAARAALQYGTTIGYPPLREALIERMAAADGCTAGELRLSADRVVIGAGSNQLLQLVADVLFDPGDIVLCGAPSYYVFLGAVENLGARTLGIETDGEGMIPEALEAEFERLARAGELHLVRAVYVVTYFDNPTGVTLSARRRAAIVEMVKRWSKNHKIYVLEDAAYREMRYYGDDVPSLRSFDAEGDTVIHTGSFSKSFSPGIRVGWAILPPELLPPLVNIKANIDFGSPNFNQTLMATVLARGLFDAHVAVLRETYRQKIDAILAAADELLTPLGNVHWVRPTGGLYLWLRLPEGIDTGLPGRLFQQAVAEGMLYVPGEACYPDRAAAPRNMLRLSFGVPSAPVIRRGMEALARALRRVMK